MYVLKNNFDYLVERAFGLSTGSIKTDSQTFELTSVSDRNKIKASLQKLLYTLI
jgi:hypothetical protein